MVYTLKAQTLAQALRKAEEERKAKIAQRERDIKRARMLAYGQKVNARKGKR